MTDQTDRIKQMAQEAGLLRYADESVDPVDFVPNENGMWVLWDDAALAKFAALVAEDEQARWAAAVKAMHEADEAYGCGFYNDDTWRANYMRLRDMAGLPKRD